MNTIGTPWCNRQGLLLVDHFPFINPSEKGLVQFRFLSKGCVIIGHKLWESVCIGWHVVRVSGNCLIEYHCLDPKLRMESEAKFNHAISKGWCGLRVHNVRQIVTAKVHYDYSRVNVHYRRLCLPQISHQINALCGGVQTVYPMSQLRLSGGDSGDMWPRFGNVSAVRLPWFWCDKKIPCSTNEWVSNKQYIWAIHGTYSGQFGEIIEENIWLTWPRWQIFVFLM